ncbi:MULTISPECIES: hypothetical protein [Pantoea]|nr:MULTISPECIES: hypothetical protein [Pantoea]
MKVFSPATLGFYDNTDESPDDAVKVSEEVEAFLRTAIIWGANHFDVKENAASVTYPDWMKDYAEENSAPTQWPN